MQRDKAQVKFLADPETKARAMDRCEHGELSERLRSALREIAEPEAGR